MTNKTNNIETVNIPKAHLRLLKPKGYFARFYELLAIYPNQKEAYRAVENELFSSFKVTRYTNYQSFKSSKSTFFK